MKVSFTSRIQEHWFFVCVLGAVTLLTLVPTLLPILVLGSAHKGVPVQFTDAAMYETRVAHVGRGHLTDGNPYFMEHADDPALVVFLGDYLHALPMLAGLPLAATLYLNLLAFSFLFVVAFYVLFVRLGVAYSLSALCTMLLYLLFFSHIDRPSNMQPFLPLLALFYLGLLDLIATARTRGVLLVGSSLGAMFYFYSYLWQSFLITLGLACIYFLCAKQFAQVRAVVIAGSLGTVVGLPSLLYILWLSRTSPYFWESLGRYGLVETHLPMMETLYSGGWVGLALAFLLILLWQSKTLRESSWFNSVVVFFFVTGLGLWIMQASNVITGKLLENAQHMVFFIAAWLILFVCAVGTMLWRRRAELGNSQRLVAVAVLAILTLYSLHNVYKYYIPTYIQPVFTPSVVEVWRDEQDFTAPLAYIDAHEEQPVVILEDPRDPITWVTPLLSRNYVLFATPGMWHLVPEGEVIERYLVSQYFEGPSKEDLKSDIELYFGRQWAFHIAKTVEREIKLCRILHFYERVSNCGTVPSSIDVIGETRFDLLHEKLEDDIKPHIGEYLAKYHVSYILKDRKKNPDWKPQQLGAAKVYEDARYELWKLP